MKLANTSMRVIIAARRFASDPRYRALAILRLFASKRLHQTTVYTAPDRYPAHFQAVRRFLSGQLHPKILSFGCATGEEALSLEHYFPGAAITGAELNLHSLSVCRRLPVRETTTFIHSSSGAVRRNGPYDVIFCMAVLQRTPHLIIQQDIRNIANIYPFRRFDDQVREFDSYLNVGGLVVIEHTQYQFSQSSVAERYRPYSLGLDLGEEAVYFDADGRRASAPSGDVAFLKLSDA